MTTRSVFLIIIAVSLLIHFSVFFMVLTAPPPPPPSQEDYASWVKKVSTLPRDAEVVISGEIKEFLKPQSKKQIKEKAEVSHEETAEKDETVEQTGKVAKAIPAGKKSSSGSPSSGSGTISRAQVRESVKGVGLLGLIGVASDEGAAVGSKGSVANLFAKDAGVSDDLGSALAASGGNLKVADAGTKLDKISRKGGGAEGRLGAAEIGPVAVQDNTKVEVGARKEAGVMQGVLTQSEAESVSGEVDQKAVGLAISRRNRGFVQCYERGLKLRAGLKGKIVLEWSIDMNGRVDDVRVISDSIRSSEVLDCIVELLKRTRFPKASGGSVTVKFPFVFQPVE